jgi:polysaccharide export outer membrane protein
VKKTLLSLLLCSALTGCGGGHSTVRADTDSPTDSPPYVIGAGDKLSVFVFGQPSLSSAALPVRPDGRISTPLINDLQAAGKTPSQLSDAITEQLKKYVRDPVVTVMVLDFVGPSDRQIRVIGEAAEPLAIPYKANMHLLDVVIMTKGLTKFAAGNSAVIQRIGQDGRRHTIPVRLSDLIKEGDIDDDIAMQPGDTLIIPQSWF